jgi:uncharacterized protein (DUF1778 family)
MSDEITPRFFHWMESHNISRTEAASLLGVDERSLSTYRSRGLPRKKQARALQLMQEKQSTSDTVQSETRLAIPFTDEEFDLVERAAQLTETGTVAFVRNAANERALEDIAKDRGQSSSHLHSLDKVAEDETPYRTGNGNGVG